MVSIPDKTHYRAEHDPYNDMETSTTRPDYIARQELRDAEKSASKKPTVGSISDKSGYDKNAAATEVVKNSERNQTSSNFINSVKGRNGKTRQP